VAFYGLILLAISLIAYVPWRYVARHRELLEAASARRRKIEW